jgi:hypothetical protein
VEEGSLEAFAAAADRKIVHDLQFTRLMGLPDSRSSAYLSKLNNENNRQEAAAGRSGRGSKISGGGGFQRITHLFGLFSQSPGVFLGCPENPRACPKHAPSTPPLSALAAYLRLRGRGGGGGSGASTRDSKAKSHSKGRNGAIFIGSGGGGGGGDQWVAASGVSPNYNPTLHAILSVRRNGPSLRLRRRQPTNGRSASRAAKEQINDIDGVNRRSG